MRRRVIVWAALLLMLSCLMCAAMAWSPAETQAAPALLPTRTTPRPTPTPAPVPTTAPTSPPLPTPCETPRIPEGNTSGSVIELRAAVDSGNWAQWWTRVQWQDAEGQWQDVEGWQGGLDSVLSDASNTVTVYGVKRWWVEQQDAGTGPFRWLVYTEQNCQQRLAASEPFYLPPPGQFIVVTAQRETGMRSGYAGYACVGVPQQLWQGLNETVQAAMVRALCEPARRAD